MAFINTNLICSEFIKVNCSSLRCGTFIYLKKRCFSSKRHSLELLPDVEELLDSGSIKHRKHPGIRKIPPIQLPPKLVEGVNKLITKENERNVLKEAEKLLMFLSKRRLPLEKEELDWKVKNSLPSREDGIENIHEVLTREQLKSLRKQIQMELGRWKPIEYNQQQCLAYLAGRLSANFASISKVFMEIKSQLPTFQPKSFFDFGSGVGSAVWAAHTEWGESLREYFCVDSSSEMNELSQTLLTDEQTEEKLIKTLFFRQFLPASSAIKFDLVVSAFSMLDLPSIEDRLRVIDTLWRKTNDILVIIEFGNFAGFFSVVDARDYILQIENRISEDGICNSPGAHIISPCPHEYNCPMLEGTKNSCGVHVSYERLFPRHQQVVKKDWISYVVLRKGQRSEGSTIWPRLVQPVLKKSKHVYCRACCSDGKINEIVVTKSKHGRNAYRCARSSNLGDLLPVTIQPPTVSENIPSFEEKCKDEL